MHQTKLSNSVKFTVQLNLCTIWKWQSVGNSNINNCLNNFRVLTEGKNKKSWIKSAEK